ncbi:MAG: hypothetical protein NT075_22920 [Chloroflexi bacterium]|nr:hypothetical protein [Chloroflexota bacterium]
MNTQQTRPLVNLPQGRPRAVRIGYQLIHLLLLLSLLCAGPAYASPLRQAPTGNSDTDMTSNGTAITAGLVSTIGDFAQAGNQLSVAPKGQPPALLARQDYQKVYDQANALLTTGVTFRQTKLQLPPSCKTVDECKLNYENFNNGELFFAFCANYASIDVRGYCAGDNPSSWPRPSEQIRGQLVRAREMFGFLALADPADMTVLVNGASTPVRAIGRTGVLSATREIANIHMIFGNEFMVDALDYRFSGGDPRADQIIAEELAQLDKARQQFELGVGVLAHAFNADFGGPSGGYIGDYFGEREFDLFGLVSERMVGAISEMADRYRQQGEDAQALDLYARAFANQYVQAMALATSAAQQNAKFLENGGYEIISNLERLRAQAQSVHEGINPFGFVDAYVPLQTYDELRRLVQSDFLRDATEDESRAENAQREFDQNRTALAREMQNLRLTYDNRLLEICGPSQDSYKTCLGDGGLMKQNYFNLRATSERLNQIQQRMENVFEQVRIEQERTGKVIQLTLQNGDIIAATAIAQGAINALRITNIDVSANSANLYAGVEVRGSAKVSINPLAWDAGFEEILSAGTRFEHSETNSSQTVWDPQQEDLAKLESEQALQQAINQAEVLNANSAATIKTLLLQTAELAIEKKIVLQEMNRLLSEHNDLINQYNQFLNLREQARADLVDSNLANPAFRILRDQTTVEASRSIAVAAQFAYLTAKALESEFLIRYPNLNNIFKARTADDVDNFINGLEAFRVAIGSPGERNRFPYRISVAKDLFGLSDENLDPTGKLSASERARLRFEGFQAILQRSKITDTVSGQIIGFGLPFATTLLNNKLFTPNIWNNRIAGVGLPADVPNTQGIAINVLTRQFGDIGTPEVQLTHDGHASYRTVTGQIVEYVPENAKLAGFATPPGFESKSKTATILANVNGNGRGAPSSALFNRSVAASNWTLRIDLRSPFNNKLDIGQLEDIEINMDTTGIALVNNSQAAQLDARRLQASFVQPVQTEGN